ncbi:MAG: hypothetical protein ABH861_03105 [Patescibacteria group bacterium]
MRKLFGDIKGLLALFLTVFIVLGVVAAAYVTAPKSAPKDLPKNEPALVVEEDIKPIFLLVDDSGARLVGSDGIKALKWPDDVKLLNQPLSTMSGRDIRSGERIYLATDFVRAPVTDGIHSPDGRRSLHPYQAKPDGTGMVEVRLGDSSQTLVLRLSNGRGVRDARPLGWWDDETLAVVGFATSTRAVFAVSLSESLRVVAPIPDDAGGLEMQNGQVWYVTLQPGEGLESPPGPPSILHRITLDGEGTDVVEEKDTVIAQYRTSVDGKVVYNTYDGGLFYLNNTKIPMGEGVPLDILYDGRVLMKRDLQLMVKDPETGQEDMVMQLPENGGAVFAIQKNGGM